MQNDHHDFDFVAQNRLLEIPPSLANTGESDAPRKAREVIGQDDRQRVTDTLARPFRWVCQIFAIAPAVSVKGVGTGFVIGRRTILTAAHNLWVKGHKATRFEIYLAVSGDRLAPPLGHYTAVKAIAHPLSSDSRYDIAAIFLEDQLPSTLVSVANRDDKFPLAAVTPQTLQGLRALVSGYPKSYPRHDRNKFPTPPEGVQAYQYYCISDLRYADGLVHYNLDTEGGQSGSPLITVHEDSGGNRFSVAIGVHIEGDLAGNKAVPLDDERMRFVDELLTRGEGTSFV